MKFLKSIFDFYLHSSIHVGIEVCCFVLITCLQLNIPYDLYFLGFVFFGTITGYNFIKYAGTAKFHHLSLTKNLRLIQLFSLLCFIAFVFFALELDFKTLLVAAFFGIFTVFYAVPIFPNKKNLRSFKGLKIFVIAFVVAGLTIIVPLFHHSLPVGFENLLVFVQRIAFIIAVVIPFEIRDLDFDEAELGTIPQKIGEKNAKILGFALLVVFLVLELIKTQHTSAEILAAILISIISAGFILFSTRKQSEYFASFWVEAIPIFWFLIFWLLVRIFS